MSLYKATSKSVCGLLRDVAPLMSTTPSQSSTHPSPAASSQKSFSRSISISASRDYGLYLMLGILYPIAFLFVVLGVIRLYRRRHRIERDKIARQEKILQPYLQPKAELEDKEAKEREENKIKRWRKRDCSK